MPAAKTPYEIRLPAVSRSWHINSEAINIMLTKIGAIANGKNFCLETRMLLYTVESETNAMLGNIVLVNSVASASFSGADANPGAIRIVNSFAKMCTKIVIASMIQKIKENTRDEKYRAPLNFSNDTKSV